MPNVQESHQLGDCLPCTGSLVTPQELSATKSLLEGLPDISPDLMRQHGIPPEKWTHLLGAAVESLRGTSAATTADKYAFLAGIFDAAKQRQLISDWKSVGHDGRDDFRVELPDGTLVGVEAKGCPDGNNMTIWERPAWANEFIIWSLCPNSSKSRPGSGVWSGISTRIMPKVAAEGTVAVVDAFVFYDARCGSEARPCPKRYGLPDRASLTDIAPESKDRDRLPPPCIFLLPRTAPSRTNQTPLVNTLKTCKFALMLLQLFNVPPANQNEYVNSASLETRYQGAGQEIKVSVTSGCWPDGSLRQVSVHARGGWKPLQRE